jgi:hypothetical protein
MSIATTASPQCGWDPTGVRGIATARQPQLRFNAAADDATRERRRADDPDARIYRLEQPHGRARAARFAQTQRRLTPLPDFGSATVAVPGSTSSLL